MQIVNILFVMSGEKITTWTKQVLADDVDWVTKQYAEVNGKEVVALNNNVEVARHGS